MIGGDDCEKKKKILRDGEYIYNLSRLDAFLMKKVWRFLDFIDIKFTLCW